jgi:hypothetical protein
MAKHFVVAEVDRTRNPIGPWLLIAVPDDFDVTGDQGFPAESLQHPLACFADQEQAIAERDRLNRP